MNEYKVDLPPGQSGDWKVFQFTVTKDESELDQIRNIFRGIRRYTPPGTYTKLVYECTIVMSDTPDEIRDHLPMIRNATGNILINGLGLGVVLQACANKTEVTHITVVEKSADVIKLVGEHYKEKYGDKITIINADAMTWTPPKGVMYDAVWHDIWPNICTDNLEDMHTLHRKYGHRTKWQGSWSRELLEYELHREKQRDGWRF